MGKKPSELYDSIYQSSLKSEGVKPVAVPPRRKINLKPAITIVAAAALIVGTVGVYNRVEYIRDQRGVNDFYKDSGYYAAIQDTIWDSIDDGGHKYGYNQNDFGQTVITTGSPRKYNDDKITYVNQKLMSEYDYISKQMQSAKRR